MPEPKRKEHDEEVEMLIVEGIIQVVCAIDLGAKDLLHDLRRHSREKGVVKYHGSVHDTSDWRTGLSDVANNALQHLPVGNIPAG